ncbi:hypothetical protein EG329_004513 [Mollisiaceae sp. DMI_Dod_QoI]|nr:hypothetical protein EG329_004513 [Helotiales sp. DMI_Dod_QoI]
MTAVGCSICGAASNLICSNCKSTIYCSVDCQAKDEDLHGILYRGEMEYFDKVRTRPDKPFQVSHKLAMLFDDTTYSTCFPELYWVETRLTAEDGDAWNVMCDLKGWFYGVPQSFIHTQLGRKIQVWKDATASDRVKTVACKLIKGGKPVARTDQKWPTYPKRLNSRSLVVMGVGKVKDRGRVLEYRDIIPDDLQVILDCLLEETFSFEATESEEIPNPYINFEQPDWTKAVKISFGRVDELPRRATYRTAFIRNGHPKFGRCELRSTVSEHMGIPLLVKLCGFDPVHKSQAERESDLPIPLKDVMAVPLLPLPLRNVMPIPLLLNTDTSKGKRIGVPGFTYQSYKDIGLLVYREDKQDITQHQVEALCEYFSEDLCKALKKPKDGALDEENKKGVLDRCAERFTEFFENYKQKKIMGGDKTWIDATIPTGMKTNDTKEGRKRALKRARVSSP